MKYDKMVAMNQKKNQQKVGIAKKEIEKMLERKERISIAALSRNTGFAKTFFYRNSEVREALDNALLQQGECYNPKKIVFDRGMEATIVNLKTKIIMLKKTIKELENENRALEKKVEELMAEIDGLKK